MRSLESFQWIVALGVATALVFPLPSRADETPPDAQPPVAEAAGQPPVAARPEPPAPPRKYLEAGARLFNTERFDLAASYLRAAHLYRDRLSPSEQIVLDVYRERLAAYQSGSSPASKPSSPASTVDQEVAPAATVVDPVKALARRPDPLEAELFKAITSPGPVGQGDTSSLPSPSGLPTPASTEAIGADPVKLQGSAAWRDTSDSKQKARWLLQLAREQILKRNFEVAGQAIAEARGMNIKWSLFDETPERVTEALEKARVREGPPPVDDPATPRDRKSAKAQLRAARESIQANDLDRAEAIVREVRSWGIGFGFFDDTPERVATTLLAARRREEARNAELMVKSYLPRGIAPDFPLPTTSPPPK